MSNCFLKLFLIVCVTIILLAEETRQASSDSSANRNKTERFDRVHCNPNNLRHDKRLNCVFQQNWAVYGPRHLGKCTCSGRPCMTLSHASLECDSNINWSLVNDNRTANAWGVGCKDENSCPRCLIPQADFSKCYTSSKTASEFVCVCRHDQREYNVWCQLNGSLDIWNPRGHTKCEKPNFALGVATELTVISLFVETDKISSTLAPNQSAHSDVIQINSNWHTILIILSCTVVFFAVIVILFVLNFIRFYLKESQKLHTIMDDVIISLNSVLEGQK
ncbi:uncharacterized protein LOC132204445 [Neocloeon triangulifer]|uniref:uncharacterized protein LOC132204445 n=1 Tax=Neocloeon triangulifer TaxID=2078957 RepID=UPI00286F75ED|nr:uncharacterized protein LOC132204445 [Neocloeon triangulifer]